MREIYLDNAATTRTHPQVAQVALDLMTNRYGNPSSLHAKGLEANIALEEAKTALAGALGCDPGEITFTSGGTEANNLAVTGGYLARRRKGNGIVATAVEHSSVLDPIAHLGEQEASVRLVPPRQDGSFDPEAILAAIDEDTVLLSCMMVNSEVGAIAPIAQLAAAARRKNRRILIHCDAVQAFGKLPFSASRLGVDLLSVSGHKLYAPKGIGALYVRRGTSVQPLFRGGGPKDTLRPGTGNVPLACAFAQAARQIQGVMAQNLEHYRALSEHFVKRASAIPELCINSPGNGAPYIWNISLPGYLSGHFINFLSERGIYVSGGSACSGGRDSRVLTAMGLSPQRVKGALRVSFCPDNTLTELDAFFDALLEGIAQIARS